MMRMPTERPPVRERRGSLWFSATVRVVSKLMFVAGLVTAAAVAITVDFVISVRSYVKGMFYE